MCSVPHGGLVGALNAGLELCRGEFIARMDADDIMHRLRLGEQVRYLQDRPSLVAAGCHVRLFPRDGLGAGRRNYESWLNSIDGSVRVREEAFVECPVAHPALMIRREAMLRFGYRDQGWPEDYDLILRLLAGGYEVGVVTRRLLAWRNSPDRLSRTNAAYAIERFTACKAQFLADGFLAASERYVLWGYGATGRALRRELLRHGKTPAFIVDLHPRRLGQTIFGAPVIPPAEQVRVRDLPIVASVAGIRSRREVRSVLTKMGFCELRDFVVAA